MCKVPKGAALSRRGDHGATAPKAFGAGGKGIRTPDLLIANETLYQLSYTPGSKRLNGSTYTQFFINRKAGLLSSDKVTRRIEEGGTWPRLFAGVGIDLESQQIKNMKYKSQLVAAACIAALAFGPASLSAAGKKKSETSDTTSASPAETMASPTAPAARPIPFHGAVSAVDQTAKTFTISGKKGSRVLKVTDKTAIVKGTAPGSMSDITENEKVSGSYWKMPDGSMEAKTVKIGKMAMKETSMKKEKKSKKMKESPSPEASPAASPPS